MKEKNEAFIKKLKKESKGITLIALVITIIVLLILASVSIAMLTGENGILTKATTAKEKTQEAEIIERAQIDIVEVQAENDGEVTAIKLKEVLNKYFDNVPETLPDDLSTVALTTKSEYGNYSIKVSDIYNGAVTYKSYSIGDEVTVGGESFYVIKASGTSEEKVILLAEKNIDTNNLTQSDSAGTVRFSSTQYWPETDSSGLNLNNYESSSIESTDAIEYAKAYGAKKGATGRLMTVEEVYAITGVTFGTISSPDWIKTTSYWLSSVCYNTMVYCVYVHTSYLGNSSYADDINIGVRPVIEISKSLIS